MGFCDSEIYTYYKSKYVDHRDEPFGDHNGSTDPDLDNENNDSEEYQSETDDLKSEAANWFISRFNTYISNSQWELVYSGRYCDDPRVSEDNCEDEDQVSSEEEKEDFFCRWRGEGNAEMGYWTDGHDYWLIAANSSQYFTISCVGGHPDLQSNAISFANSDGSTLNENLPQKEDILRMSGDEVIEHFKGVAYDYVANQDH